ncbi:MAG: response regulator [Nitrospiraceae bacterium]|nr:MAG: response regulator [Nitrospiraceae bacterium]
MLKIMIVDDCQITRKLLGHYLTSKGYSVVFAENGLDAIEKLGSATVNLIMTDLNMPYMDGLELIKTLQGNSRLSGIPVLMVTSNNDEVERDEAFRTGARGFLVKPVTADTIEQHILRIIKDTSPKGGMQHV